MSCLITKLMGTIDNDNLPYLGHLVFVINTNIGAESISGLTLSTSDSLTIKVEGNGCFAYTYADLSVPSSCLTEATFAGVKKIYLSTGNYKVHLYSKYTINTFNCGISGTIVGVNIDDLEYSTGMTRLTGSSSIITGTLKAVARMSILKTLEVQGTTVSGDISNLGNNVKLEKFDCHSNNAIFGSIESIASGQVSAGRTSGTLQIISNGVITYNGTAVANIATKTVRFGTSMVNPTTSETAQGYQIA